MTVQELIDRLNRVEDKSIPVYVHDNRFEWKDLTQAWFEYDIDEEIDFIEGFYLK